MKMCKSRDDFAMDEIFGAKRIEKNELMIKIF